MQALPAGSRGKQPLGTQLAYSRTEFPRRPFQGGVRSRHPRQQPLGEPLDGAARARRTPLTAQPGKEGVAVEPRHPTADDATRIAPALDEAVGRVQGERWGNHLGRRQVKGNSLWCPEVGKAPRALSDRTVQRGAATQLDMLLANSLPARRRRNGWEVSRIHNPGLTALRVARRRRSRWGHSHVRPGTGVGEEPVQPFAAGTAAKGAQQPGPPLDKRVPL